MFTMLLGIFVGYFFNERLDKVFDYLKSLIFRHEYPDDLFKDWRVGDRDRFISPKGEYIEYYNRDASGGVYRTTRNLLNFTDDLNIIENIYFYHRAKKAYLKAIKSPEVSSSTTTYSPFKESE